MIDLTGGIDPVRESMLDTRPHDPLLREAVNMWIWDDRNSFGLPRIAVEAIGRRWDERAVQVNIGFPDGRVLLGTCVGRALDGPAAVPGPGAASLGAGPLSFTCIEPFQRWRAIFSGPARDTTVSEQMSGTHVDRPTVDVEFEVEATMAVPPWYPGEMSPEARNVLSNGKEGSFVGDRYEQLFRAEGSFTVDGTTASFKGGGLRIRRQGRRNSGDLWGHCWQSALFPSGRAFGYCAFPPGADGTPSYNEGYVFDGVRKVAANALVAPWMTAFEPMGGDVSLTLDTGSGPEAIAAETVVSTFIRDVPALNELFQLPFLGGNGRLGFHQGIARYTWDGEEAYGMIERSYPLAEIAPLP